MSRIQTPHAAALLAGKTNPKKVKGTFNNNVPIPLQRPKNDTQIRVNVKQNQKQKNYTSAWKCRIGFYSDSMHK